mmetsp:Transcript_36348/g.82395  ORF Transcript_36348/g.82395 Transcript_36348/m.82395 type:complete len:314 (+) Transcript_36348:204-1145(+)
MGQQACSRPRRCCWEATKMMIRVCAYNATAMTPSTHCHWWSKLLRKSTLQLRRRCLLRTASLVATRCDSSTRARGATRSHFLLEGSAAAALSMSNLSLRRHGSSGCVRPIATSIRNSVSLCSPGGCLLCLHGTTQWRVPVALVTRPRSLLTCTSLSSGRSGLRRARGGRPQLLSSATRRPLTTAKQAGRVAAVLILCPCLAQHSQMWTRHSAASDVLRTWRLAICACGRHVATVSCFSTRRLAHVKCCAWPARSQSSFSARRRRRDGGQRRWWWCLPWLSEASMRPTWTHFKPHRLPWRRCGSPQASITFSLG